MILIILDGKRNFMFPSLMYINYCLLAQFHFNDKKIYSQVEFDEIK